MQEQDYIKTEEPYIHNINKTLNEILKKYGPSEIKILEKENDFLYYMERHGIGYYPVKDFVYDKEYFEKYKVYEDNGKAKELTKLRLEFVKKFWNKTILVDIGIGSGTFVKEAACYGYDVNEEGIMWLKLRNSYWDPYTTSFGSATFWDSLEHIENPAPLLSNIKHQMFVSCPIYRNLDHIKDSKHFRPDEHFWYWTEKGIENFMKYFGFKIVQKSNFEEKFGREDIMSFVFERKY